MKLNRFFLQSFFSNYSYKNLTSDYKIHNVCNLVILLSDSYTKKEQTKLLSKTISTVKNNYYSNNLIILSENENLAAEFLYKMKLKHYDTNLRIVVNTTRSTKIAALSKLIENNVSKMLFICPSYDKILFSKYLKYLGYKKRVIFICIKTGFFKNLKNSWNNSKIISSLFEQKLTKKNS